MKKAASMIVAHGKEILAAALLLCAVCAVLALRVPINADMTKYLPDSSPMKQGIDLMAEEFSSLEMPKTIRVMLRLPREAAGAEETGAEQADTEQEAFLERLREIENISSAARTDEKEQNGLRYVLFTVSTDYDYQTKEEVGIEQDILALRSEGYDLEMVNDNTTGMPIPFLAYFLAVTLLLAVLFVMCASWVEPFLFLAAIGIAIVLNLGTCWFLGSVSETTWSMSAILQLVLSMDYSVILMNRYRQEKAAAGADAGEAMVRAWQGAFPSIASSGMTTFVGLIMLVFMRFKIGMDLGLVLAKGVLLSMICVLTVLPTLILLFDRAVVRTAKKVLYVPTGRLARFSYRFRYILAGGFVLLFALAWFLQTRSETSYSLSQADPIAEVFAPANPVVLLYGNGDEEAARALAGELAEEPFVDQVFSYGYLLGRQMTPEEMAERIRDLAGGSFASYMDTGDDPLLTEEIPGMVNEETLKALFAFHGLQSGGGAVMSVEELFAFISGNLYNPLVAAMLSDEMKDRIDGMNQLLASAKEMLVGDTHSLMMLYTSLPVESEETEAFIRGIRERCGAQMEESWYLIGNSPMNVEMRDSFRAELLLITLLTAAAIFVVVAVTFRQLLIPLLLVALVQCGVFMTVSTVWLLGYKMYFLAIIIVQCILMGATVDYAILMTSYYREIRRTADRRGALALTYEKSIHTVLTSALFMIIVTGALGVSPVEPTIGQICQSISLGALSAALLVIFVLPGMLSALDGAVTGRLGTASKKAGHI